MGNFTFVDLVSECSAFFAVSCEQEVSGPPEAARELPLLALLHLSCVNNTIKTESFYVHYCDPRDRGF
jgi:hypothetical protein